MEKGRWEPGEIRGSKVKPDIPARTVRTAKMENKAKLDLLGSKEKPDPPARTVRMAEMVNKEARAKMERMERLVLKEPLEHPAMMDAMVKMVNKVQPAKMEIQEPMAETVRTVPLAEMAMREQGEFLVKMA